MKPIKRSQLITVVIPQNTGVGAQVKFPDIPELRDAVVDGIEVYSVDQLSITPNGERVVTTAGLAAATVNFLQESDRRGQDFPAYALLSAGYGGIWKEFTGWRLNWQKCYVQVVSSTPFEDEQVAIPFNIFYHYER